MAWWESLDVSVRAKNFLAYAHDSGESGKWFVSRERLASALRAGEFRLTQIRKCGATTERELLHALGLAHLIANDDSIDAHRTPQDEDIAQRYLAPEDVKEAHASVMDEFHEYRPERVFVAFECSPRCVPEVLGIAVTGTPDSHEGWRGPALVLAISYLDDPGSADKFLISGRHSLEQLRAAIDYALGDGARKKGSGS